jgi:hypothetical protein
VKKKILLHLSRSRTSTRLLLRQPPRRLQARGDPSTRETTMYQQYVACTHRETTKDCRDDERDASRAPPGARALILVRSGNRDEYLVCPAWCVEEEEHAEKHHKRIAKAMCYYGKGPGWGGALPQPCGAKVLRGRNLASLRATCAHKRDSFEATKTVSFEL